MQSGKPAAHRSWLMQKLSCIRLGIDHVDARVLEVAHVPRYRRHAARERAMAAIHRKTVQESRINVHSRSAQHHMCAR